MTYSATVRRGRDARPITTHRPKVVPTGVIRSVDRIADLSTGSVLIRPGTSLPHGLDLRLRPAGSWNLLTGPTSPEFDRLVRDKGWHWFFLVPSVASGGIGLSRNSAIRKALRGVLRQIEAMDLNAMEITNVDVRSVLNIYYAKISAHPRHLRDRPFLRDLDPDNYVEGLFHSLRIFDVIKRKVEQEKRRGI